MYIRSENMFGGLSWRRNVYRTYFCCEKNARKNFDVSFSLIFFRSYFFDNLNFLRSSAIYLFIVEYRSVVVLDSFKVNEFAKNDPFIIALNILISI